MLPKIYLRSSFADWFKVALVGGLFIFFFLSLLILTYPSKVQLSGRLIAISGPQYKSLNTSDDKSERNLGNYLAVIELNSGKVDLLKVHQLTELKLTGPGIPFPLNIEGAVSSINFLHESLNKSSKFKIEIQTRTPLSQEGVDAIKRNVSTINAQVTVLLEQRRLMSRLIYSKKNNEK